MGRKTKRNKEVLGIIFLIVVLLFAVFFLVYPLFSRPLEIKVLDAGFNVGKNVGYDINTSLLTFGRVLAGSTGTRKVLLENSRDFDVVANILISKSISGFIFSSSHVIIPSNEVVEVSFTLIVPKDTELGNYTGKIKFEISKLNS